MTSLLVYEFSSLYKEEAERNMSDINKKRPKLNVKIIQTQSPFEGLAFTPKYDIVKIRTITDEIYDGKRMKGRFVRVDTYTYQTNEGYFKTVPVFVPKKDYKYYKRGEAAGVNSMLYL